MRPEFHPQSVAWALDQNGLDALRADVLAAQHVAFDLETTGLDPYEEGASVVLLSLTIAMQDRSEPEQVTTWLLPLDHPESPWVTRWRSPLRQVAESLTFCRSLFAHHGKFDVKWIAAKVGIDLASRLTWDSMVAAKLLDENESVSLKAVTARTFQIERWDDFDLSRPGAAQRVPLIDLGLYAARDTFWTYVLSQHQRSRMFVQEWSDHPMSREEVEEARLGNLALTVGVPTVRTLAGVEQSGIRLDRHWTGDQRRMLAKEAEELFDSLTTRYGPIPSDLDPSLAPTSKFFGWWAEQAVEAGDLRVVAVTKTGKPQWSSAVLKRLERTGSPVAADLLAWRKATKRVEFLTKWLQIAHDGVIRASYNSTRTDTGRLSSSDPNMQQVTKSLRPAFVPRPGYLLADLDYSQIELRIIAALSGDENMIEAFNNGDDLHTLLASRIFSKPTDQIDETERAGGKAGNFGLCFGQSAEGLQVYAEDVFGLLLTPEDAAGVVSAYFDQWPGVRDWQAKTIAKAHRDLQIASPLGRVRRLPDLRDGNPSVVSHAERQSLNAPVQGMASDFTQIAAASIAGHLPGHEAVPDVRIAATVHDSIVVEVPEADWQRATARCMRRMLDVPAVVRSRFRYDFDVPLGVDASVSTRWGLGDVGEIIG